jgi:hypothetical protein
VRGANNANPEYQLMSQATKAARKSDRDAPRRMQQEPFHTNMMPPPVLDALFQVLVTNDQVTLDEIQTNRAMECLDFRALGSTDHPDAVALDLGLGLTSRVYVTPFFEGPRAFFISRHISLEGHLTESHPTAPLHYSLSFDSNFAEKLRATLNGENIEPVDRIRVIDVLMLKANNARVQFDVVPFLYENIRLARDNAENERLLNTVIAFRMLDYLNWKAFRNDPSRFDFGVPAHSLRASLQADAEKFLTSEYASPLVLHHEANSLGIQALLLRFATLWHGAKPDAKRILTGLIEFSLFELGFLPVIELSLIWSGIAHEYVAPFFSPITGRSAKMLKEIRRMAYDMTHLRLMEQTARLSRFGSFFIPHFVSIDARWHELLRLNPVRSMLIDDTRKSILFARAHEADFQLVCNECESERVRAGRSLERIAAKRAAASSIDVESMQKLVAAEERIWRKRSKRPRAPSR